MSIFPRWPKRKIALATDNPQGPWGNGGGNGGGGDGAGRAILRAQPPGGQQARHREADRARQVPEEGANPRRRRIGRHRRR
ncbi:hypothetical protein AB5I41_03765 [Sphingomonas sp. MMS24-JH45]